MKVEVFPQGGTVWYPMLESGEVHFGINVPGDILTAYMGESIYQKPTKGRGFDLRTLMLGSPLQVGLLRQKDACGLRHFLFHHAYCTSSTCELRIGPQRCESGSCHLLSEWCAGGYRREG
jgi:hypothetical protein